MTQNSTKSEPRIAIYAGSFDPFTNGHADIMRRSLSFVDELIVAVAVNVNKKALFSSDERVSFIEPYAAGDERVIVRPFSGLLVDLARETGASVLIRGLRGVSDFEYEFQMAQMNRHLFPALETLFMVPSTESTFISSSLVREVSRFGGNISGLVHPVVAAALSDRFTNDSNV